MHFWAWGTEQPRLKCHAPEKLGPLAVAGETHEGSPFAENLCFPFPLVPASSLYVSRVRVSPFIAVLVAFARSRSTFHILSYPTPVACTVHRARSLAPQPRERSKLAIMYSKASCLRASFHSFVLHTPTVIPRPPRQKRGGARPKVPQPPCFPTRLSTAPFGNVGTHASCRRRVAVRRRRRVRTYLPVGSVQRDSPSGVGCSLQGKGFDSFYRRPASLEFILSHLLNFESPWRRSAMIQPRPCFSLQHKLMFFYVTAALAYASL